MVHGVIIISSTKIASLITNVNFKYFTKRLIRYLISKYLLIIITSYQFNNGFRNYWS